MIARLAGRRRLAADQGTTLVELLVVMIIFTLVVGIVSTTVIVMYRQQVRQSAVGNNLDASRKLIQQLDRQVRYANAINTPGTGTDGNFYVEWRSGNTGQQQTCTQWRHVVGTNRVESRTWLPPLAGTGAVTATAWSLQGLNIKAIAGKPIFSISATSASNSHQVLSVQFTSSSGKPSVSLNSQVTIAALNSTSSSAPTSLCNEVGRP